MGEHVLLVGMMGSGKSTVGRIVADRMRRPFEDSDVLVERRTGRSVPAIFAARGEAAFRAEERAALCAALALAFDASMLAWPPGRRDSDGVWAPAWYAEVEKSTGFAPPAPDPGFDDLPDSLKPIAEAARPLYERLARHKLTDA